MSTYSTAANDPGVNPANRSLPSHELAEKAARLALEKKGKHVVIMDLREQSSVCDYFVLVSGESEPQVKAIAERVEAGLKEDGESPWHVEGLKGKTWLLLDYVHVVVHVFHERTREIYMLERLWGDAPREAIETGTGDS